MQVILKEGTIIQDDIDEDGETHTVEYVETADMEDGEAENENEDEEECETDQMEFHRVQFQKVGKFGYCHCWCYFCYH